MSEADSGFNKGNFDLRRAILSLLIVVAISNPGQARMQEGPKRNDYPFQCGAIFGILAEAYGQSGDNAKANLYKSKFNDLSRQAETEFEKLGRTKEDAQGYMKEHVNSLSLQAEKDSSLVANFARRCNELFPS